MATVNCPQCSKSFDPTNHLVTGGSALAGAGTGAWVGSGIGLALGPLGAIAGTIPGAIVGGTLAYLGVSKVTMCPKCKKVFTV